MPFKDKAKQRAWIREWRLRNKDKVKGYKDKDYLKNREQIKTKRALYYRENKLVKLAHSAVQVALGNGTLKREICKKCESLETDAHHSDYSKPLDVIWLCRSHHMQEHQALLHPSP